jgi:ATP-dependent RNA helicase RhlB
MTDTHLSEVRFDDLDIHADVKKGILTTGFEFCTPIQAISLPLALQGKDISGQAQTGTGKTAAFLIACFHHLLTQERKQTTKKNPIRALVLAPTRELAIQIHEDGKPLVEHTGLKMGIAYGGTDYDKQRSQIEAGIDVLIGTPGRIIDYFKQGVFSIDALEVIILDEADRMFDLGFIADIRYLFRRMPDPENRLNMLFSATLSLRVAELAYEHMSEPEIVKIEAETITADRIEEIAYMPSNEEKIPLLLGILRNAGEQKCVVFINTKHMAEKIEAWMLANDFKGAMLTGDVPQKKREKLLNNFKEGLCNILVATDVAARGGHIPDVRFVVNFDLPADAEDYVHRIGRTARAGASGTAISLICETFAMNIVDIEEYIEHSIPVEREISDLLFKDAIKPDLSNLRSNRKPKGGRDSRGPKGGRPTKAKPHSSRSGDKFEKKDQAPAKTKADKPIKPHSDSPEAKDAARLAELERRKQDNSQDSSTSNQVKPASDTVAPANDQASPIVPLRGRRGQEIPAIG